MMTADYFVCSARQTTRLTQTMHNRGLVLDRTRNGIEAKIRDAMFHPSRGGVRGGADQFEWEDIKADKHRECYLGHSLKAPVGRWQKGKDLEWYTRGSKGVGSQLSKNEEKDAIRRMEAEVLAAALGKGPVKKVQNSLTKQELTEVCRKGQLERDSMDIERVEGMGFGRNRTRLVDQMTAPTKETLAALAPGQVASTTTEKKDSNEEKEGSNKKRHKKEKKMKREKRKHKKRRRGSDGSDLEKKGRRKHRRHDSESEDGEKTKDQLWRRYASHSIKREKREHKDTREGERNRRVKGQHESYSSVGKEAKQHRRHDSDSDHRRHTTQKSRKEKIRE